VVVRTGYEGDDIIAKFVLDDAILFCAECNVIMVSRDYWLGQGNPVIENVVADTGRVKINQHHSELSG
jgi:hypothetical protein